jgi:amino acid permease
LSSTPDGEIHNNFNQAWFNVLPHHQLKTKGYFISSTILQLTMAFWNFWENRDQTSGDPKVPIPPSPMDAASPHWKVPARIPSGFSPAVTFCFTLNYLLGTGFLTIPWAFVQGGLALSTLLLFVTAIAADVAKDYILETMARAEVMLDGQMHWIKKNSQKQPGRLLLLPSNRGKPEHERLIEVDDGGSSIKQYGTNTGVEVKLGGSQPTTPISSQPSTPDAHALRSASHSAANTKYLVKHRKFEINAFCQVFLGKSGMKVFTAFIYLYMCGLLWAYTSVFSSAMARAAPIFRFDDEGFNYTCYAVLFGCIVVPLSCLELEEQVSLQVFLTGCRFIMLFLMLGTTDICARDMEQVYPDKSTFDAPLFQPISLHKMLPIVVVANMYHHSIPGLSHPVADKKKLGTIFQLTSVFTSIAYSLLGVVLGSAFGERIEQSSNLNWKYFHAGTGHLKEDGELEGIAWWAKAVSWYIICFPAVDVVSAFPLNAITVANNMFGAYYGKRIHEVEVCKECSCIFNVIVPNLCASMNSYRMTDGEEHNSGCWRLFLRSV